VILWLAGAKVAKPIEEHTNEQLQNVIDNHRRWGQTDAGYYREALAELDRRKGGGLSFEKSMELIRTAATEGRFLSYKDIADGSGCDWMKVRYLVNEHLGRMIEYAHKRGWPMLSAIVVNKQHVEDGGMEPSTLKGFVEAARWLGYNVTDERAFLKDQQQRVFDWAKGKDIG